MNKFGGKASYGSGAGYICTNKMQSDLKWEFHDESILEAIRKMLMDREEKIEFILRNNIKRPIKGKITKRKLKCRGINGAVYYAGEFIGIDQRGKVIGVNGEVKFPLSDAITPPKMSALRGMTSSQRAEEIDKQLKDLRSEWDRTIL